jgi:hypothetical protein
MTKNTNLHLLEPFQFSNTTLNHSNQIDFSIIVDPTLTRLEVILLTNMFILTIVGNLVVIVTLFMCPNRRNKKSICFSFNKNISRMSFYILHLSIADINVAFMSILPQIIWRNNIIFNSSHFLCKLVTFCQVIKLNRLVFFFFFFWAVS